MARIEMDDSLFPILIQRMPGVVENADVEAMIVYFDQFCRAAKSPYALIVDCAPDHRGLSALQRKRVADWSNSLYDEGVGIAIATAIVLPSAIARGALTALDWISPPRQPRKVVATSQDAFDYCVASLHQAGVSIPPHVRRQRDTLGKSRRN